MNEDICCIINKEKKPRMNWKMMNLAFFELYVKIDISQWKSAKKSKVDGLQNQILTLNLTSTGNTGLSLKKTLYMLLLHAKTTFNSYGMWLAWNWISVRK